MQGWSFSLFAFYLAASHLTAEPVASAPSGTVVHRSPIRRVVAALRQVPLCCPGSGFCSLSAAPRAGVCQGAETQSHVFLPSVSRNMRGNAPSLCRSGPEDNCFEREVWASSPVSCSSLELWPGGPAVKKSLSPLLPRQSPGQALCSEQRAPRCPC